MGVGPGIWRKWRPAMTRGCQEEGWVGVRQQRSSAGSWPAPASLVVGRRCRCRHSGPASALASDSRSASAGSRVRSKRRQRRARRARCSPVSSLISSTIAAVRAGVATCEHRVPASVRCTVMKRRSVACRSRRTSARDFERIDDRGHLRLAAPQRFGQLLLMHRAARGDRVEHAELRRRQAKGWTAASTRDAARPAARCNRPYASSARRRFLSPFPLMTYPPGDRVARMAARTRAPCTSRNLLGAARMALAAAPSSRSADPRARRDGLTGDARGETPPNRASPLCRHETDRYPMRELKIMRVSSWNSTQSE